MSRKKKKARKKKSIHKPNRKLLFENSLKKLLPDSKFIRKYNGNKLSDVINEFAEPLLEKCSSFREQEKMLSLSILVWNMCVTPQEVADNIKKDLHEKICKGDKQTIKDMEEILQYLIVRKNSLYKDDKRFVISYNITKIKDGLHLEVAYPHTP
jgi:hypothetical protein